MSADRIEQRLLFLGEHDVELKFQTEQMQADVMIGPNEWCQLFNQYIQPWSHHSELEVVILWIQINVSNNCRICFEKLILIKKFYLLNICRIIILRSTKNVS